MSLYEQQVATIPRVKKLQLQPPKKICQIQAKDGTILYGALYKPDEEMFGPPPYKTMLSVYGGPGIQLITYSWANVVDMRARELFNTLRLVRPAMAIKLEKEKVFADMIQPRNKKKASDKSNSKDIAKLKKIISPFVHVHKGHILEDNLPGLKQSVVILNPFPLQKSLIENLGDLPKTFEYEHKVALVSVHPSLILHSSLSEKDENLMNKQELKKVRLCPDVGVKTKFVMELIRLGVSLNEHVLIFSQYIRPLKLLNEQITHTFGWNVGKEVMMLKGGLHQKDRQMIINKFNDPNSKAKVLLASTKTYSEGIHLVGASRVVLLDVDWNLAVEKQAISRAYRLGQKKVVHTYHLMVVGTTEEEKYDVQVERGWLDEMVFYSSDEEPKNKHAFELEKRTEYEENSRTSFSQAGEDDAGALDRNVNLVEYLEF
ncbi:SNF2 domain-containing protein CLASSY 3-like protein [Tanacetum coccineum]